MSLKTLPLLFINLGGEMMYILDQRLRAQNIPQEKAKKVLHDIIGTMFNKRFMEELFKPQDVYSKKAMRTVFDRLAHASIMRLNSASMDKLYDLMTMAFKYQISLSLRPSDILLVTLNHMDAMFSFVKGNEGVEKQVDLVYRLLIQTYSRLSAGEFMLIRHTLLNFFQDMHIRVSIFLKDKVQNSNGRFILPQNGPVPYGSEEPGLIRHFNEDGEIIKEEEFKCSSRFGGPTKEGSLDQIGNRVTKLGTNMYSISRPAETMGGGTTRPTGEREAPNPMAKAQLDLLSTLIGGGTKKVKNDFRLNLFKSDADEERAEEATVRMIEEEGSQVVNIDAKKRGQSSELESIMQGMTVAGGTDDYEDDILDLMDQAQ